MFMIIHAKQMPGLALWTGANSVTCPVGQICKPCDNGDDCECECQIECKLTCKPEDTDCVLCEVAIRAGEDKQFIDDGEWELDTGW